jgi:hypothetical protein
MTSHAQEEMEDDRLTVFDVEHALLTGSVAQKQRDCKTGEAKYILRGMALAGGPMAVVVKMGPTNKLVIITVYSE